jgi:hypothetical protein
MKSIDDEILRRIRRSRKGVLFFADDFTDFGNGKAVGKALERLENRNIIKRVARGIYARLVKDPILGLVNPSTEAIAQAIKRRDKARMIPAGAQALNALGLSTQVPMNAVYLTDGSARTIRIGKRKIVFKRTAPRNLAMRGKISSLVVQALKEIGKKNVTEKDIEIILGHLEKEDQRRLKHDIRLAPEWIRIIMRKALKPESDE